MFLRYRVGSVGAGILCGAEAEFVGLEMTELKSGILMFV